MKSAEFEKSEVETLLNFTAVHFRIDKATAGKLKRAALKKHTTQSKILRHLIKEHC